MSINQPPQQVPQAFAKDPALNDFFKRLLMVVFQLYKAAGGEGGSGGDTYITEVTNLTQEFNEISSAAAAPAMFASALRSVGDLQTSLAFTDAKLLAQIGALHQRINDMATTPRAMALGDLIAGTSDASPDTLHNQSSGVGLISAATAFNSSASSETLSVYILPAGGDAASVDPIWVQDIAAGEAAILTGLLGQVVPNGGSIVAFASTTDVVRVTISGSDNV